MNDPFAGRVDGLFALRPVAADTKRNQMIEKFKVGQRVTRAGKEQSDPRRRGVIERAYMSMPNGQGQCVPLYSVRWDDSGHVEVGYMDINLALEEK